MTTLALVRSRCFERPRRTSQGRYQFDTIAAVLVWRLGAERIEANASKTLTYGCVFLKTQCYYKSVMQSTITIKRKRR